MNTRKMICISDLITERKWTRNLIREFLGEPDDTAPNPYYPTSHRVKLYKIVRVTCAEKDPVFVARMKVVSKHRKLSKAKLNKGKV